MQTIREGGAGADAAARDKLATAARREEYKQVPELLEDDAAGGGREVQESEWHSVYSPAVEKVRTNNRGSEIQQGLPLRRES